METLSPPTPPSAPENKSEIDLDYFAKVELRVARIEAAESVPNSKKLLKLSLDLGPLGKRQIAAGIAKFYSPESLVGLKIVIIANLKPATLAGVQSQGMLLAASSEDGSLLSIVSPASNQPEGSLVR